MPVDPSIKDTYPAEFDAWWQAGGYRNFASFLVATGQITLPAEERRDLVVDRVVSAADETKAFLTELLPHP